MIKPYNTDGSKKEQVEQMFNSIAPKYDFLNHFLSFGIDKNWRKKSIKAILPYKPEKLLDVATGTADFAIEAAKQGIKKIVGLDISAEMLKIAQLKLDKRNLNSSISLVKGDSEMIEFENQTYDAVISGFGVRNFENLELGLKEMNRVLRIGGVCAILEFSKPDRFPVKTVYNFYFNRLLPFFGKLISKDKSAYAYLPESVFAFPEGDSFLKIMNSCGFKRTKRKKLSFGIASLYIGEK